MISITTYWQQFKDCVDHIQPSIQNKECSNQITIANHMIEIGLTIERLGITQILQVAGKLHEKAKLFDHQVSFISPERKYDFFLPKITDTDTLIFAIVYYQHLMNYESVEYKGSIIWPLKTRVIAGVNEKKISTRVQSNAMLSEIKAYCESQNIDFNESDFIKKNAESAKDYTTRLFKTFGSNKTIDNEAKELKPLNDSKESNLFDELTKLEKSLEELRNKRNQFIAKMDSISKKLTEFHKNSRDYFELNKQWNNKWFFTKFFYWIMSWFSSDSLIKNLKTAHEQVIKAENDLNQEFSPYYSVETYCAELKKQLKETDIEYDKNQKQISEHQLKLLERKQELKQQEKQQKDITVKQKEPSVTPILTEVKSETNDSDFSSNLNHYYGFFKEHLPSRETLGAIAVGAAAIIIQNLM